NRAGRRRGFVEPAAAVVVEDRMVKIHILRAEAGRGRVGQAGEIEVRIHAGDLPDGVGVLARRGFHAADRFGTRRAGAGDGQRRGHGQGFVVAAGAVFARHLRRAGGRVAAGPAGVDAHFMGRVLVDDVVDVPGRAGDLRRPAK